MFSSCVKEVSEPIEPSVLKKLKLLPLEPVNVIYLNFNKIKKSKYWKDFVSSDYTTNSNENVKIFDSLGINFIKDIDEIILATEWDGKNTIIISLNKPYQKSELSEVIGDFSLVKLSDRILLIMNDQIRYRKIKEGRFEPSFIEHPHFRRIINSIKYKDHFWFFTRNTAIFLKSLKDNFKESESLENLFRSINFIIFSIKLENDFYLNSHWECTDENKAYLLKSVLNGFISILALTQPNDPFIREISKANFYVDRKGVEILIKFSRKYIDLIRESIIAKKLKELVG